MAGKDVEIVIGAQDKASATLAAVSSRVGSLATSFSAAGPAILGIGAAIGGAVAAFMTVKSVIEGVVGAANTIDALSDKANGLGESVANLQEFQFALSEAGNISGEKAISVLEKLSATIGGIAAGDNKAGLEALQQLGLDAQQLSLEGPVAQFQAIQAKLSEIENTSERAAMAQKLFGRSAYELLPALTASADAMKESAEYARKVGASVKDEGVTAVASMNDAIGRVGLGLQGLYNSVAIALAPAIENIALTIADWIPPLVEAANNIIPAMVDGVAYLADAMLDVAVALGLITEREGTWAASIEKSRQAARNRAAEMEKQRDAMRNAAIQGGGPDAAETRANDTIAALERQLAVLQSSEESVKMAEQLATARNQAEADYITMLQNQVMMLGAIADMEKEEEKRREEARKQAERINRNLTADTNPQQAVQGRLLTRGTGGDIPGQILNAVKSLLGLQQQALRLQQQLYNRDDEADVITKLVVP